MAKSQTQITYKPFNLKQDDRFLLFLNMFLDFFHIFSKKSSIFLSRKNSLFPRKTHLIDKKIKFYSDNRAIVRMHCRKKLYRNL